MELGLGPLDIVKLSEEKEKNLPKPIDAIAVAECLEGIVQQAAKYIEDDVGKNFLYKNPNGWRRRHGKIIKEFPKLRPAIIAESLKCASSSDESFATPSPSTSSEDFEFKLEPWALIRDFEYSLLVHQVNEFVQTWELTPATKFVVIAKEHKIEHVPPYGNRYFVEAHFSKPTPKCPNPLAVAKAYFFIHVSRMLPTDYPINVTYKFEGYKTEFYAMGARKIISNKFQNYFINSILHMKLAFYAKLCSCRNPLNPVKTRKKSTALQG